jgi:glycosidase
MPYSPTLWEFHVSRWARDHYRFDQALFAFNGNVILGDLAAARQFAQQINDKKDLAQFPEQAVKAGQINALGLLDELLHALMAQYRQEVKPAVMAEAMAWLEEQYGAAALESTLLTFLEQFPPLAVYRGEISREDYLAGESDGLSHRHIALEEMLFLWLTNMNPATAPLSELFDDTDLAKNTTYREMIGSLEAFFEDQPPFGEENLPLFKLLRQPALSAPDSLTAQLEYVRGRWITLLGEYRVRLLRGLDAVTEEETMRGWGGPGPAQVIEFNAPWMAGGAGPGGQTASAYTLGEEPEQFSPDLDWMPNVILMAKNAYVWLDQLSKKYGRTLSRLDQVPDEELDFLQRAGFTGLWLIGVWERSVASERIKHLCGNPDAVASAYSLKGYDIAAALGGYPAYQTLRERLGQRGIRFACDMVPNHFGLDSDWVINHPQWFLSLPYSPYPNYTFNGVNLSPNDRVGVYLEDHYYDRTDAAVVFKRVDQWTGEARYIYHGNDGTSFPWNDTAQIDYLNPEAREAIIQTILHVARLFPIIRFDAAMTLAKRHIQRLWYPEPGQGGAIPSRSEYGLTKEQFDQAIPEEFWREVVDRVAQEVPDTLLLAEAFWMMEGYFVRTLGMHRVYNSAFMNMMRDEKNNEYRLVMKNTLEFNPEILKRYVNFMNNPDEKTAIEQFGGGDKYFGICTVMITLPGLPMFGHGQLEGFTEKYGMEYKRAYYDEQPNWYLLQRHEKEIYPLLHRRRMFAEVDNFLLYDFFEGTGSVNENVFAYSNGYGSQRSLVLYHNVWGATRGRVHRSAAYSIKTGPEEDERTLVQRTLGEGLNLPDDPEIFVVFRDYVTGLEHLQNCQSLAQKGLEIELGAYRCHVFLDFQEVSGPGYAELAWSLGGKGVPSVELALRERHLQPVHIPFRALVNGDTFRLLHEATPENRAERLDEIMPRLTTLLEAIRVYSKVTEETAAASTIRADLETIYQMSDQLAVTSDESLNLSISQSPEDEDSEQSEVSSPKSQVASLPDSPSPEAADSEQLPVSTPPSPLSPLPFPQTPDAWGTLLGWVFVRRLGEVVGAEAAAAHSRTLLDEWLLSKLVGEALQGMGLDSGAAAHVNLRIKWLTTWQNWYETAKLGFWHDLLQDADIRAYLQINRYNDIFWYNGESMNSLLWWLECVARLAGADVVDTMTELRAVAAASGYQVEKLIAVKESEERLVN